MPYFILTTHQKGGVGKSTLTYNLAINLKDKAKVCIVDMDVQGSLSDFKNFSPVPVLPPDKLPELKNSDIDFVFIDTPPYLSNKLPELCSLANVIIIPTKAGVLTTAASTVTSYPFLEKTSPFTSIELYPVTFDSGTLICWL